MADETGYKKFFIATGSIFQATFALIVASFYAAWWANESQMQTGMEVTCLTEGGTAQKCNFDFEYYDFRPAPIYDLSD